MPTAVLALHGRSTRSDLATWRHVISSRTPFRTSGSLRSQDRLTSKGRLGDWRPGSGWLLDPRFIDYVIYSYETPIAWHDAFTDEWTVPNVSYSPTTTQQQNRVRTALRMAGIDYHE